MARSELIPILKSEISPYLGLPYFINTGVNKNSGADEYVGKGNAKMIALATIEFANENKIKIIDLSPSELYRFQKKHHLGIDCSGLVCQIINVMARKFNQNLVLDVRHTSANMLTSLPLATQIDLKEMKPTDLVRQKNGHHVAMIVEINQEDILYVESSLSRRGVKYGQININDPLFFAQGLFRLNNLSIG